MIVKLSLYGAYGYDSTIFDKIIVPQGVDAETVVSRILLNYGYRPVYPPNTDILKSKIGNLCAVMQENWSHILKALTAEYEILDNYNGVEERTIIETGNNSGNVTGTTNATDKSAAYDTNTLKTAATNDTTASSDSTAQHTINTTDTFTRHGNLGVTTSQQMVTQEIEMRQKYNIIDIIASDIGDYITMHIW